MGLAGCGTDDEGGGEDSNNTDGGTDATENDTPTEDEDSGDVVTETTEDDTVTEVDGDNGGNENLEISDHSVYIGEVSYGVRGTVINNGNSEMDYVEVNIEYFDAEGTSIARGSDNTFNLAAGQEWKFEIREERSMSDAPEIDNYDIEVSDDPLS